MSTYLSTVTGISSTSPSPSIYARATPVTFGPTFSAGPLSGNYHQIWQFGDTEFSYESHPTHTFMEKGVYPVSYTVIIPNSAIGEVNDEIKTVMTTVSVFNYIEDEIVWASGAPSTYQAVKQTTPFVIAVSSANVDSVPSIQLYSRGSKSQPWQEPQQKWSHLKPQWRFTDLSANVISSVIPTSYTPITIDLSGNRTFDGSGSVVGLSATIQCYYIDDLPSQNLDNSVAPVTLVATLVTSAYTVDENTVRYVPGYLNTTIKAENDHSIRFLQPHHLKVTVNGITPLSEVVWKNAYTPYTVTVHPDAPYADVILKNFPQVNFLSNSFAQSLSTYPASSVDFDTNIALVRYDEEGFDAGGYFRGTLYPLISSYSTAVLVSGTVEYGTLLEPFGVWLSNPQYHQVIYLTTDNLSTTSTDFLSSTYTITDSQVYGVARVAGDVNDASWFTDPTNDRVYRISRSFGLDREFNLATYPQLSGVVEENDYGLTPTSIVLNSSRDVWVTLFDGVSTLKLNQTTGAILAVAAPPVSSTFIDVPGLSGFGGEGTVRPNKVEVNSTDSIWVSYNHPLSSFIIKYDNIGDFVTQINLPIYSQPYDMIVDDSDNLWVTLSYPISGLSGRVVKYDNSGTLLGTASAFRFPSYITLDLEQNPWFVHDYNKVSRVDKNTFSTQTYLMSSVSLSVDPPAPVNLNVLYDQELGGIAVDWFDRVWVLNSYDNRVYMINADSPTDPVGSVQINPYSNSFVYSLQGFGDMTGLQWYNKFGVTPLSSVGDIVTLNLSGQSNAFSVQDFEESYDIRKINEDFDGVNKIRDITLQQNIKRNDVLFDRLLAPIAGTLDGDPLQIGTAIYEKIANFVANQGDVDTCNIPALYSLHQMIDIPIDGYDLTYPADIKRLMDLLSISLSRLKPTRSKFSKDFKKYNQYGSGPNLGSVLNTSTYVVSAGSNLVVNIKYSTYYEKIQMMPIGIEVLNVPEVSATYATYPTSAFPLSTYPLSAYYGWGLDMPVANYYNFYEYVAGYDDTQVEGSIDWENPHTTLTENISSVDDWYKDGGLVDLIFNYYIFKGLDLIKE